MGKDNVGEIWNCTECGNQNRIVMYQKTTDKSGRPEIPSHFICEDCLKLYDQNES
jgi:hypothetical protein